LHYNLWICLALLAATFAVYAQVRHFDFVNFDDPDYAANNPHVRHGITPEGLEWAFTSGEAANWFPLTRLSHLLDGQLFGLRSGWHHLTSVLWHALAALLLFAFLQRSTHARWCSALVAFLFALHPLHVESVAWVAERKDVLGAFFWFLALWAYVRYAERPRLGRYLLVLFSFCLGLMAKPMIVTLPFVLLLLDVWPLRRLAGARVLWEKLPLFALSAAAAVATYLVQRASGAVEALGTFPLGLRIENALVTYIVYIAKMFLPARLAVFYPYPRDLPVWQAVLAAVALAGISVFVLRWFRSRPYLAVGWFWYLGTLVPVIGLVQVGAQARADRYTYIPMIGLSIMLAWGAAEIPRRWPRSRPVLAALAAAACSCLAVLTWVQVRSWSNSESLFRHALAVTDGNYLAHHNLGVALAEDPARLPEAITHYQAALRIKPDYARALTDLGSALSKEPGRLSEAVAAYRAALRIAPDSPIPHHNLANTLSKIPGRLPEAIAEYEAALRIDPDYAEAHNHLGLALSGLPGRLPEAIAHYQAALRIQPDYAEAHANLASALADIPDRLPEAISEYEAALRIEPDSAETHYNLGVALSKIDGRAPEAIAHFETALRIRPGYAEAHNNLGVVLSQFPGRLPDAISHFETALRIMPGYADAHYNLGVALSNVPGRMADAIGQFEAAQRIRPDPEIRRLLERLRAGKR
jgi:tetratricopeptide (TPR) repeat protein